MAYKSPVSPRDYQIILDNITKPTIASKAAHCEFDAQDAHIDYILRSDPVYRKVKSPRPVHDSDIDKIVNRVTTPTVASCVGRRNFNQQAQHFQYLYKTDYKFGRHKRANSAKEVSNITCRIRSSTIASQNREIKYDIHSHYSNHSSRSLPDIAMSTDDNNKPTLQGKGYMSGYDRHYGGLMTVNPGEMKDIVTRLTKPTVASEGGKAYENKTFVYVPTPKLKTLPVIAGLETRYLGGKKVSKQEFEEIISRLTRPTKATQGPAPTWAKRPATR
ncbi:unnamed protein product [Owenia fusiformis]|uniref:Uncharacterized protein n=1 Tax=Owenia fusiformis TaxID=6347 RepID=A0A8J1XVA2_OWEFU|nr:unnamed protein product [Owenia fusiformis]